jgi:Fe-Mn family superoxide dismutase
VVVRVQITKAERKTPCFVVGVEIQRQNIKMRSSARSLILYFAVTSVLISLISCNLDTEDVQLPNLPYGYGDLEPHIDEQTMRVHHTGHHQTYTDNLNAALHTLRSNPEGKSLLQKCTNAEQLLSMLDKIQDESIRTKVRNNGGGYVNHKLFWKLMVPEKHFVKPSRVVIQKLESEFGSFDSFVEKFNEAASKLFGSGWVWLLKSKKDNKLYIRSFANQDSPHMLSSEELVPVLGIDVWEHSYYLKYQNKRAIYIQEWWKVVNWKQVEHHLVSTQDRDEL